MNAVGECYPMYVDDISKWSQLEIDILLVSPFMRFLLCRDRYSICMCVQMFMLEKRVERG